ncbi:hypothetical protein DFH06DRAFT_1435785 [Mycena polygramma]|nr:hypothetical protein DFH06DRAFT_1435785 [Mycena polygramma]
MDEVHKDSCIKLFATYFNAEGSLTWVAHNTALSNCQVKSRRFGETRQLLSDSETAWTGRAQEICLQKPEPRRLPPWEPSLRNKNNTSLFQFGILLLLASSTHALHPLSDYYGSSWSTEALKSQPRTPDIHYEASSASPAAHATGRLKSQALELSRPSSPQASSEPFKPDVESFTRPSLKTVKTSSHRLVSPYPKSSVPSLSGNHVQTYPGSSSCLSVVDDDVTVDVMGVFLDSALWVRVTASSDADTNQPTYTSFFPSSVVFLKTSSRTRAKSCVLHHMHMHFILIIWIARGVCVPHGELTQEGPVGTPGPQAREFRQCKEGRKRNGVARKRPSKKAQSSTSAQS